MTAEIRDRLVLALDVPDLGSAVELAEGLQPHFGTAKIGLELFTAAGPDAIRALAELGYAVFADLKLHDIPTTVARASEVVGRSGARHLTIHTAGGADMLRAGNEAFLRGADEARTDRPSVLAVTVLTSDGPEAASQVPDRVRLAVEAGCGGIVCAVSEAAAARRIGPDLVILTPGIRPAGADPHDQARPATPTDAVRAGSDLLVIGRAVTGSPDPEAAAAAIVEELARATASDPMV